MRPADERYIAACVDMAGRMGAGEFQVRYDENEPVA